MADGCHFDKRETVYIHNRLTDFDEILYDDAYCPPIRIAIKILNFQNPR